MSTIKKINIINYNLSNMFSIYNAIKKIGYQANIINDYKLIQDSDLIVLPGTGSYTEAMKILKTKNIDTGLKQYIKNGKPFLGICLGFQLLFSDSQEIKKTEGLRIFTSKIKKLGNRSTFNIGWRNVHFKNNFLGLKKNYYYFVHGYYADINKSEKKMINSYVDFDKKKVCSSISIDNIFATQFHPEKSGKQGLKFLDKVIKSFK